MGLAIPPETPDNLGSDYLVQWMSSVMQLALLFDPPFDLRHSLSDTTHERALDRPVADSGKLRVASTQAALVSFEDVVDVDIRLVHDDRIQRRWPRRQRTDRPAHPA